MDSLNRLIIVVQSPITNQAQKAVDLFSCKTEIFQVSFYLILLIVFVSEKDQRL